MDVNSKASKVLFFTTKLIYFVLNKQCALNLQVSCLFLVIKHYLIPVHYISIILSKYFDLPQSYNKVLFCRDAFTVIVDLFANNRSQQM